MRLILLVVFAALLSTVYWWQPAGRDAAAAQDDGQAIWSIGVADNSSDEFSGAAAGSLDYEIKKGASPKQWPARHEGRDADPPVFRIRFALGESRPAGFLLAVDGFFTGASPRGMELEVNGKRGFFRIRPAAAEDLDERQANSILHSRQAFRIPLAASLFQTGDNQLGIAFAGEGGTFHYDALRLEPGAAPQLTAAVEPTIFFRRAGDVLKEVTEVTLSHPEPLGEVGVTLRLGRAAVSGKAAGKYDFGEHVMELEAPAVAAAQPYTLRVSTAGGSRDFTGEFRPEKRWRIFAGLKIHNDIGFTDLQPHVEELDTRNTDGVIDIMARFPFYRFNLETSWLVENYLASRNGVRSRQLLDLTRSGRIAVNALYLNLLTGLCTGEEMHRSLYYSRQLRRRHGVPMKYACLTDAPSHTWFTPSLLADAGVPGFAIGSNQARAPLLQNSDLNEDSPFYWEGIDGRRVLAWFARSYLQLHRLVGDKPSVDLLRRTVPQFLARYRRGNYPVDAVLLYGLYTDNADIREGEAPILKEWNQAYEYPKIIPATDADYYDYLASHFAGKLPVFRGDAGAYWEDGAGSTAAETALNRDTQRLLPVAEMLAAWASLFDAQIAYPAEEFREAWKNLMFYDEHTWGAHNSISQPGRRFVTEQWEFKRAYALRAHWSARNQFLRAANRLVQYISIDGPTMFVFNPDLWTRTDLVEIELEPNRQLVDLATGKALAMDVVEEKDGYRVLRFLAEDVPGLGYKAYGVRRVEAPLPRQDERSEVWEIESPFYRVVFDRHSGAISELYDKQLGRNLVDSAAPHKLNELVYVSGGERSRIVRDLASLPPPKLEAGGPTRARLIENLKTPFGRRIRIEARAPSVPLIETEVTVHDRLKRVDIRNRIRKEEVRSKEAVYFAFPFRVSPPELAYQVQNAWIRPNQDQLPGACRDWFTTQNLVTARDGQAAIAWATPDAPLITLTDINRGLWLKQLETSNGHVYSYALNNYWFTNYKAAQGGELTFRYFITSARSLTPEELARFDAETRSPLAGYPYYDLGNVRRQPGTRRLPLVSGTLLEIDAPHAQVTAIKKAEDGQGYILRLRETAGRKGAARLRSPLAGLGGAHLTNAVEDNLSALAPSAQGVEIPLEPHRFTTVRLLLEARP